MAPKSKTPAGEMTAPELRKLIRAHNILSKIVIPKGTDRQGLIKLIEGKNYIVDHEKKVIRPASAKNIKVSESITKIDVLKSHARGASRGVRNKMLENADTWSKVHCH